jgi:putative transposase
MEQELRKTAIERYLKGESPKSIYSDIKRSKNWFFKWLKRYESGEPQWYKDKSRAPIKRPTEISRTERQRIISARAHLESQKFAQIGHSAIKWELNKSGYILPSDSTIKRVLKSEGLIKKKLRTFQKALSTHISMSHLILTIFTKPILLALDT